MENLPSYIQAASLVLSAITILATVIVQVFFRNNEVAKSEVRKYSDIIYKVLGYLPTLGLNPRTKKLQEAYDDLNKE